MNAQILKTPWRRSSGLARGLAMVTLAAGAWALSTMGSLAHARSDVHWSIGVHVPGVVVGASNAPPVYHVSPPVYYAPRPIYYAPRPIYYAPPPVYYAPRPVYRSHWGHGPRWDDRRHGHGHRNKHRGHGHRR